MNVTSLSRHDSVSEHFEVEHREDNNFHMVLHEGKLQYVVVSSTHFIFIIT